MRLKVDVSRNAKKTTVASRSDGKTIVVVGPESERDVALFCFELYRSPGDVTRMFRENYGRFDFKSQAVLVDEAFVAQDMWGQSGQVLAKGQGRERLEPSFIGDMDLAGNAIAMYNSLAMFEGLGYDEARVLFRDWEYSTLKTTADQVAAHCGYPTIILRVEQ